MNRPKDDSDSFELQVQRRETRARLINLAARKGIPTADREDIASAVIEEAIRCQAKYDPRRGSFPSWIMAIGKNVIWAHLRKQNAQKRKPEGGTISFDAESTIDDQYEPKNTPEADRRSSEEIEHLIETANLSEKEQKAIASRLDRKGKKPSIKFSSSTGRRATRKMRQVRADEEFHQSPQGPDASECAYGNIPAAERSAAVLFDQLRRTKWFVDAIGDWRKSAEWSDARAFLQEQTALKRFPLRILNQHWSERLRGYRQAAYDRNDMLHRQFEAAVDITLAFPEWPTVGYCQLPPDERCKRLQEFGWTFRAEPFWEITEPTFEVFAAAADEGQQQGWHLFVFSHGFHSVEDWVRLLKRIVNSIGADVKSGICEIFPNETRTGSRPHAIRAPGTWNPKTNQLGAIFFTSVAPLFQRERKKEVSSFLYHSTDGANAARLNDSCPPSFYCGGHQNWLEQFAITQPSTRHAQLRELVYCIFRQVSQPVGRRIADLQYQSARLQPKATLAEHLEEFEQLWTWMTTQWRAELSGAEEEIFIMLRTQIERDLFKILRNFARRAFSQKEKDFPFPLQHVAKRLGVSFQYVSKLRNRFVGASIIVQTAPAMANRLAARFRWCPQAD